MSTSRFTGCLVAGAGAIFCATASSAEVVISNSIADAQIFPTRGQDRNELILGNANGPRVGVSRFDTAVIAPFVGGGFELVSAKVRLTEQAGQDANNGDQTRGVYAYMMNTAENKFWNMNSIASFNRSQDGSTPWHGNISARPGRRGGEGTGGDSNVDTRADIDSNFGVAFGEIAFQTGNDDSVEVDLTNQSGLTLSEIMSILVDWVNGDNAGIGFIDSTFGGSNLGQVFYQSSSVSAGNSVLSSIDGDMSLSGVAQVGEGGPGAGTGPQLLLEFVVPEPASVALAGLGALAAMGRRRRA